MIDGQSEVLRETGEAFDDFAFGSETKEQIQQVKDDNEILDDFAEDTDPNDVKWFQQAGALRIGKEWDFDVAKAIGLKTVMLHNGEVLITPREWDEIRGIEHETCEGDVACIPFRPSVDLSVAFVVARMPGLLSVAGMTRLWIEETDEGVAVSFWRNQSEVIVAGEGATLCLAVCGAILRFKEKAE